MNLSWDTLSEWVLYDPMKPLLFNSAQFLVLFLSFFLLYILLKNQRRARVLYVIAFSLFFYYKSSGFYFWLLIFSSVVDFYLSSAIYRSKKPLSRKLLLVASCVVNLGLLGYFKYTGFLTENINALFDGRLDLGEIFLPVGISFYTFQTMSYTIDIYRRELRPARSLMDFMFFVSFFPQLVAGPIVRAKDFIPQIYERLSLSRKQLSTALFLIMGGLIKKAVISNFIGVNFVDRVFEFPTNYSAFENLMGVYGYTLQIYCDFSGYSDMAIGIALLLGFQLPENFRTPYQSASVTEFWRRWHISLSSWLRDYLYISMGGNRKGKGRTYFNLFMTMLLGGLWHGAAWKFVLWGGMHGTILAIERALKIPKFTNKSALTRLAGGLLTFHFVAFCWIFFRASDFTIAMDVIHRVGMLDFQWEQWQQVVLGYQNVFILMLIGFIWHFIPQRIQVAQFKLWHAIPLWGKAVVVAAVFWLVSATALSGVQPFIYFQF